MIRNNIKVPFNKIKTIYAMADIHIRNLKRHKEYNEVFEELYKEIEGDTNDCVIAVLGDIVHAKTDMSPELVDMTSKFFNRLANIAPTIVITGNHDANLNNLDRLDALKPIIDNLAHPNLHYLKESGIYTMADTDFVVFSVFDEPNNFINVSKCASPNKIALYHGVVDGSIMDSGMKLMNDRVTTAHFIDYDIAMLGDIHKHQWLNDKKTIGYSSSLIQQNHGEDYKNHGIIKWDMPKRKGTFIPIKNNYGFYTIYVRNDEIIDTKDELPKYPRLRVNVENSLMTNVKKIIADVKTKYSVTDVVINSVGESRITNADSLVSGSVIGDISDINFQNQIISDYLSNNYNGVTKDVLDNVIEINKNLNSNLKSKDYNTGTVWKLKTLEFSNLFSYGEDNHLDFTSMTGLHGLFAPNTAGKSALMDVLLFSLFDKSSRAFKPSDMINANKISFHTKVNFEMNGEDYFIEKIGKKIFSSQTKTFTAPVKTDFWKIENGKKVSLNGDDRRYSNENIRDIIGSVSEAMLTAFSLQDEHSGIILKSNSERKSLLNSFIGIDVFEKLFELANIKNKEISTTLKVYAKNDYSTQLSDAERDIVKYGGLYKTETEDVSKLKRKKGSNEKSLISWNAKLVQVDNTFDIKSLTNEKKENEYSIKNLEKEKVKIQKDIESIIAKSKKIKERMNDFPETEIRDGYRQLVKYEDRLETADGLLSEINIHIKHKEQRLESFTDVDYDSDCEYCVDNINMFYADIATVKEQYEKDLIKRTTIEDGIKELKRRIKEDSSYRKKLGTLEQIIIFKTDLENDYNQAKQRLDLFGHKIELGNNRLDDVNGKISDYYSNQQAIEENKKVQLKIIELEHSLNAINDDIELRGEKVQQYYSKQDVAKSNKQRVLDQMEEIEKLEIQNKAYDYYLKAVHRDGIPHDLMKKMIPIFETEINGLLSPLVDFNIKVEIDEKYITFKIVYGDLEWPLELTSGMEKFVSSIALRHALMKISNKPQPNFLFIDEGWGKLDSTNLSQVYVLFNYLKGQYDLILIVSHIDGMRDVIDQLLSISKINGFSHVDNRT